MRAPTAPVLGTTGLPLVPPNQHRTRILGITLGPESLFSAQEQLQRERAHAEAGARFWWR